MSGPTSPAGTTIALVAFFGSSLTLVVIILCVRRCFNLGVDPKRRETPSSHAWFLTGKKATKHDILRAWLASSGDTSVPVVDLRDGADRIKFVTDDDLSHSNPALSTLLEAPATGPSSALASNRVGTDPSSSPRRDPARASPDAAVLNTISRYYNEISGWGGVSVHDGHSLTFRMTVERTLSTNLPIGVTLHPLGAMDSEARGRTGSGTLPSPVSPLAQDTSPLLGSSADVENAERRSTSGSLAENGSSSCTERTPLYFEVLLSLCSHREFIVNYNPYHPNFNHNNFGIPSVPPTTSPIVQHASFSTYGPLPSDALTAPPRISSTFIIPNTLPPAYRSRATTPATSRAPSPPPSRPRSRPQSVMQRGLSANNILALTAVDPASLPPAPRRVESASNNLAVANEIRTSLAPLAAVLQAPPRAATTPAPVPAHPTLTSRAPSPTRGAAGRQNVPSGSYLVSPPTPPVDEHPVIAIGLASKPYPSFLLPGRYPTSVAYVLDVKPTDEKRNEASIVLCCHDEAHGRVISRRWSLGKEWTAREGDTVGVGILLDSCGDGSPSGIYFTLNGRRIEMDASVKLKRQGWDKFTRRFHQGPDSAVVMEAGGDMKLGAPSKLLIRVPEFAGGLQALYPAVGARGSCQLLANIKGPHLFQLPAQANEPAGGSEDFPPTYEEVIGV